MQKKPDQTKRVQTVCLDPEFPCAREYNERENESVTVIDVTPGLQSMVLTGNVSSMGANISNRYNYPDLDADDEAAHDAPDYSKLVSVDMVEREHFVDEFINDPRNHEKKEDTKSEGSTEDESTDGAKDGASKKTS